MENVRTKGENVIRYSRDGCMECRGALLRARVGGGKSD